MHGVYGEARHCVRRISVYMFCFVFLHDSDARQMQVFRLEDGGSLGMAFESLPWPCFGCN